MTAAWPFAGDTLLDQARRVARSYRDALEQHAPDSCHSIDHKLAEWGVTWIAPQLVTIDPSEWVTVDVAADHTGLTAAAIYKWCGRDNRIEGRKGNDGRLRVQIGDVLSANAELRRERASRQS